MRLTDEQEQLVRETARPLLELRGSPAWHALKKAAQVLIDKSTPQVKVLADTNHCIQVASQMAYIQGIKDVLKIVDEQPDNLKRLK